MRTPAPVAGLNVFMARAVSTSTAATTVCHGLQRWRAGRQGGQCSLQQWQTGLVTRTQF